MAKSKNRWDVIYETVDEQAHKIVPHFAAQNVDYKTALTIKRNNKPVAMEIRPTRRAADGACAHRELYPSGRCVFCLQVVEQSRPAANA